MNTDQKIDAECQAEPIHFDGRTKEPQGSLQYEAVKFGLAGLWVHLKWGEMLGG